MVSAERAEGGGEDGGSAGVRGLCEAVVDPLAFAAGGDDAGAAEVSEVAGDFGLALAEDFDEVTDADFAAGDEVEEAEACGVSECGEEGGEGCGLIHTEIIYGLTYVCNGE